MRAQFVRNIDPKKSIGIGRIGIIKEFLNSVDESYENDDQALSVCTSYGRIDFAKYLLENGNFEDFMVENIKKFLNQLPSKFTDIFKNEKYSVLSNEERDILWEYCGGKIEILQRGPNKGKNKYVYYDNDIKATPICKREFNIDYQVLKHDSQSMIENVLTDDGKVSVLCSYKQDSSFEKQVAYGIEWIRAFEGIDISVYSDAFEPYRERIYDDYDKLSDIVSEWISLIEKEGYKVPENLIDYKYNDYHFGKKNAKEIGII